MASRTPETDAQSITLTWRDGRYFVSKPNMGTQDIVPVDFARSLETQRDAAIALLRLFLVPQTVGSKNRRIAEESVRAFLAKLDGKGAA